MENKSVQSQTQTLDPVALSLDEADITALSDLLNSIKSVQGFFNDQVLKDLSGILSSILKLVNAISSTDLIEILERALQDPRLDKALANPKGIGMVGLVGAMGDKEVQKGVAILVELLRALGTACHP
jgi:uncharacterized protein YjgD (DUF1641 family)